MARLDRDSMPAGPLVQAFSGSGFRVDGAVHMGGVKLTPRAASAWKAPRMEAMKPEDLADLVGLDPAPEFILLGTGTSLHHPGPALIAAIEGNDIGLEIMDSRAAARAWGVLRGEDRWIAAALLPLDQR